MSAQEIGKHEAGTQEVGEHEPGERPPGPMPRSTPRRPPPLAVSAWIVAAVTIGGLAAAVVNYLGRSATLGPAPTTRTDSMGMPVSTALYRAGSDGNSLRPLLGLRILTAWQLDAVALVVLVLLAASYLTAVSLVAVREPGRRWPLPRTASFLAGLAVCAFATNGSIAVYDQVLFSAHMLGHLALVMVAPVLLVAGRPLTLALTVTRKRTRLRIEAVLRGRVVSLLTSPPVALATYAVVIVGSHLTGVMNTIMRVTWAGQLEHLVYVLVGCQFFALVVGDEPIRWRLATPARWLMLALAMAIDTFTGVILLEGTSPVAMMTSPTLTVNPLSDTRTGGAIMWFGGDGIMAVVMVALVVGWLRRPELRRRDEQGWAEQARRANFTANTGVAAYAPSEDAGAPAGFDDDDTARSAYNDWLAQLDHGR
ncbi:MAG TPA: cytochrome c oxidase assembly protein [Jatrophihabitantaceae bacterium]|nr:cytochrome c oxidase assembly protein [Jatrophihabitantaceae bacterium]